MVESIASIHFFAKDEGFLYEPTNYAGWSDFVPEISHPQGVIRGAVTGDGRIDFVGNPFQFPCASHSFRSRE